MKRPKPLDLSALGDLIREAREDYAYNGDIFNDEEPRLRLAKKAVSLLPEADRNILVAYLEMQSERDLAKALGVSRSTIHIKLAQIRTTIKEQVCSALYSK